MRNVIRATSSFLLGAFALLALLELIFRALPVMSGMHPNAGTRAWPLYNFEESRRYQYSYGWAMLNPHRGMTNNYGHVAPFNFKAQSSPIIVIGDSYVESLMNEYVDTLQGILGARLGSMDAVYGLGVSGLSASDYLVLVQQARDEFNPRAAIFLITDGDMVESLVPRSGGFHLEHVGQQLSTVYTRLSPDSTMQWIRRNVGDLAVYDYLRGNLKFSPGDVVRDLGWGRHPSTPAWDPLTHDARQVVEWFLGELPRATGLPAECTVLLVDTDRSALYERRASTGTKDAPEIRQDLIDRGRSRGFHVVDLAPLFASEYERTKFKLDYWPTDRHWNRHGHLVAANAAITALLSNSSTNRCAAPQFPIDSEAK